MESLIERSELGRLVSILPSLARRGSLPLLAALCMTAPIAHGRDQVTLAGVVEVSGGYRAWRVMVPMRDGVRLETLIIAPAKSSAKLPIILRRTPYGLPDISAGLPHDLARLENDGYIFVVQNIRGRFGSGGKFSLSDDLRVGGDGQTVETRDAYDAIEWLVHHVPLNNGRVGIYGVSYDGYAAAATLLHPHPALKAVSEQGAPVDEWMNDDSHHYGALRLSYSFEYAILEEADRNSNTNFVFDKWDGFDWYLALGLLSNANERFLHGRIDAWNALIAHPDYDAFWKGQVWLQALRKNTVPTLNVAGFWDQEDPWGPWQIWQRARRLPGSAPTFMVAGPWNHGGWRGSARALGPLTFDSDTAAGYRTEIEGPFFAYWLHGSGSPAPWSVATFQTGSNRWQRYRQWPPANVRAVSLYLHGNGTLSFKPPTAAEPESREYLSDPARPVPYRPRPISPTYPGGDWRDWESGDQRFADSRPDVLTFVSAPLDRDITMTGDVSADLFASTSGSDMDVVVKLIDAFPEDAAAPSWKADDGPRPGEYAKSANGYLLPIAIEIRRGRYLASYETPRALEPGAVYRWPIPLRARDHVFRKGHRIMVQVQSSLFPLYDRNPQTFVPSIYAAKASDYRVARQRVLTSPAFASRLQLPLVAADGAQ